MHSPPEQLPERSAGPRVVAATPTTIAALAGLALPLAGLAVLIAAPELDFVWEHHPSHFWLVLAAGGLTAVLAYATGTAARRRGDARLFLVSLAFLSAAGFLGLHALATPGVLLDEPNTGFAMATPIGLLVAAALAAASSAEMSRERAVALMRRPTLLQNALVGVMAVWAIASLAGLPPLDDPSAPERASGPLIVLAVAGVVLYGLAVIRYLRLSLRRRSAMLLGIAAGFVLLGEAMVAVAFGRNWHATWWEWHLLMLAAFALIAWSAHRQWHEERFSDLYLEEPGAAPREMSVLFADLEGFTSFSECHDPAEVSAMLNEYFQSAIPAVVERHGGEIDRLIGDALMALFNRHGDQPDHAERAASAALAIQRATAEIADGHPGWPRFRVGVNTGEVALTVLGTAGGRTQTAVGDTVNLAARLESHAPVGGVAVGPETIRRLANADAVPLGRMEVKGMSEPVEVHQLLGVEGGS